jgi:hypothetical protein
MDGRTHGREEAGGWVIWRLPLRSNKKKKKKETFPRKRCMSYTTARTSEAKDCSQNANLHRPLMDMGMLEKS